MLQQIRDNSEEIIVLQFNIERLVKQSIALGKCVKVMESFI